MKLLSFYTFTIKDDRYEGKLVRTTKSEKKYITVVLYHVLLLEICFHPWSLLRAKQSGQSVASIKSKGGVVIIHQRKHRTYMFSQMYVEIILCEHIKKVESIPSSDEDGKGKKYFSELEVAL